MNPIAGIFIALGLVLANAFFVASEFSLLSLERAQLDALKRKSRAQLIHKLLDKLTFHLSSAQFGITLSALLLGFVIEPILAQFFEPLLEPIFGSDSAHGVAIGVSLAVATAAHLVLGEQIPKLYAISRPLPTAVALSPIQKAYASIVGPVTSLLNGLAEWLVSLVGLKSSRDQLESVASVDDLAYVVRTSGEGGTLDPADVELLLASLRFSAKVAADVLVPRLEMKSIVGSASVKELAELSAETGFSRFPVIGASSDDLLGVVHVKAVFDVPYGERATTQTRDVATDAFVVPQGLSLRLLLGEMRDKRFQMAVVLDEHGGVAGIVTLEDIVEMIVGDIVDEHDSSPDWQQATGQQVSVTQISGQLHAEEVMEVCGFEMPAGDYETLAGFLVSRMQRIPEVGSELEVNGWKFQVAKLEGHRIAWVRCEPPPALATPTTPPQKSPAPVQPKPVQPKPVQPAPPDTQ